MECVCVCVMSLLWARLVGKKTPSYNHSSPTRSFHDPLCKLLKLPIDIVVHFLILEVDLCCFVCRARFRRFFVLKKKIWDGKRFAKIDQLVQDIFFLCKNKL